MQAREVRGKLVPPIRENKGQAGTSGAQACTTSRSDCFARLSRRIKCTKATQSSVCAPHPTATPRNNVARQRVIRHRSYVLAGWLARCPPPFRTPRRLCSNLHKFKSGFVKTIQRVASIHFQFQTIFAIEALKHRQTMSLGLPLQRLQQPPSWKSHTAPTKMLTTQTTTTCTDVWGEKYRV